MKLQQLKSIIEQYMCRLALQIFILSVAMPMSHYAGRMTAQERVTLSGIVKDKATGEIVIGASILIKEIKKGAYANNYGFYSVSVPPGTYTVIVRHIGFKPLEQKVELTANKTLNLEVVSNAAVSEEVTVTAERTREGVRSTEIGTVQLEMATVKSLPVVLGETDVLKAIQLLPGVSTASEGSTGFNVRGGGADQNLILLDEAVIYNASHVLGFFSVFNPDAINNFKLYKAGIPANYGGRLSSVLDVRQRDGNNKEFGINGGIGLISSKLLVEGPIAKDKGSFMIAGRRTYADAFLALAPQQEIRDNIAYFYDLNMKLNYEFSESDKLFVSGYFGRDRFEVASTIGNIYGNTTLNVRWNHIFNDKLFVNVSAIYSNYDYEFQILTPGSEFGLQSNIISTNFKSDFYWNAAENHRVEFGFDLIDYTFVPGDVRPLRDGTNVLTRTLDRKYAMEGALYVTDEWDVSPLLTIDMGVRWNTFWRMGNDIIRQYQNNQPVRYNANTGQYVDGIVTGSTTYNKGDIIDFYQGFEPRINLRYLLDDDNSLKLSYNRTRQNLHLISNTASPTPLDLWQPSGGYLRPQTADQYSLGWFRSINDDEYRISVEGYYKTLNNLVDFVDGANLFGNNNLETEILRGEGRAYGMELFLEKAKGDLTGWISYTLARSERRVPPLEGVNGGPGINRGAWYASVYDRTHNLSVVGTYKLNDRWTLSSNFIFQSGIPATFPVGRYDLAGLIIPQYDGTRNAQRLPEYHRLDISLRWESPKKTGFRTAWVFGIYNVYNRKNAASIVFRQAGQQDNPAVYQTESSRLAFFGIVPSVTWEFRW